MSQLEQLQFSWAHSGPEGRRGWQITAGSQQALAESTGISTAAAVAFVRPTASLCLGWIDQDDYRVVYRSIETGLTGDGREGNYLVHAIIGYKQGLSLREAAELMLSDVWSSEITDDPGFLLDPLMPVESRIDPSAKYSESECRHFVGSVLQNVCRYGSTRLGASASSVELATLIDRLPGSLTNKGLIWPGDDDSAATYLVILADGPVRNCYDYEANSVLEPEYLSAAAALLDPGKEELIAICAKGAKDLRDFATRLMALCEWSNGDGSDVQADRIVATYIDDLEVFVQHASHLKVYARACIDLYGPALHAIQRVESTVGGDLAPASAEQLLPFEAKWTSVLGELAAIDTNLAGRTAQLLFSHAGSEGVGGMQPMEAASALRILTEAGARMDGTIDRLLAKCESLGDRLIGDRAIKERWRARAAARGWRKMSVEGILKAVQESKFRSVFIDEMIEWSAFFEFHDPLSSQSVRELLSLGGVRIPADVRSQVRWRTASRLNALDRYRWISEIATVEGGAALHGHADDIALAWRDAHLETIRVGIDASDSLHRLADLGALLKEAHPVRGGFAATWYQLSEHFRAVEERVRPAEWDVLQALSRDDQTVLLAEMGRSMVYARSRLEIRSRLLLFSSAVERSVELEARMWQEVVWSVVRFPPRAATPTLVAIAERIVNLVDSGDLSSGALADETLRTLGNHIEAHELARFEREVVGRSKEGRKVIGRIVAPRRSFFDRGFRPRR